MKAPKAGFTTPDFRARRTALASAPTRRRLIWRRGGRNGLLRHVWTAPTGNYWSIRPTRATYGSALSYIPEIPWNDSCAGSLLANYLGYSTVYGPSGFCNSNTARRDNLVQVVAGSGGPSNCATGTVSTYGVANGALQRLTRNLRLWQTGLDGIPDDGVRDIPDVSLFAADGVWGHFYVTCWSDVRNGGAACTGDPSNWAGAVEASFSSPIMAGIQALVNQNAGGAQGNPNYVYYSLAAQHAERVPQRVTRGDIDVVHRNGQLLRFNRIGHLWPGRQADRQRHQRRLSVSSSSFTINVRHGRIVELRNRNRQCGRV